MKSERRPVMFDPVRVAVVDCQPLFLTGICHVIDSSQDCELVAQGDSHANALRIAEIARPQILLLDTDLPGGGIATLESVSKLDADIKTIMLSSVQCEVELSASFSAGARGYVKKNGVQAQQLLDIVRNVHRGEMYTEPSFASAVLARRFEKKNIETNILDTLSRRESDILDLVAVGLTNKEIALRFELSEKTIKHYMTSILQKLQARNRVEAALMLNNLKETLKVA